MWKLTQWSNTCRAVRRALERLHGGGFPGASRHFRDSAERATAGRHAEAAARSIHAVESVSRRIDPEAKRALASALHSLVWDRLLMRSVLIKTPENPSVTHRTKAPPAVERGSVQTLQSEHSDQSVYFETNLAITLDPRTSRRHANLRRCGLRHRLGPLPGAESHAKRSGHFHLKIEQRTMRSHQCERRRRSALQPARELLVRGIDYSDPLQAARVSKTFR